MSHVEHPAREAAGAAAPCGGLVVSTTVDPEQWDRCAASCGGGFFHTHAWARFVETGGAAQALFFEWRAADGTPSAVAVAHVRPPSNSPWRRLGQKLSFASPPAGAAPDAEEFVDGVTRWARAQGPTAQVEFGSFEAETAWTAHPERLGRSVERLEFLLPVTSEGPGEHRLRKGARYSVKRAQKAGLGVRTAEGADDVREFSRLHALAVEHVRERKSVDLPVPDEARLAESLAPMLAAGRARLYVCAGEEGLVAGCLFGVLPPRAYYLMAGLAPGGRDAGAGALTLFSAIHALAGEGCTAINLGGVSAGAARPDDRDHGLYEFKLGFGATPRPCVGGIVTLRPWRARLFDRLAAARRRLLTWRR